MWTPTYTHTHTHPHCHPAGDLESATDTLGGFRNRAALTRTLMFPDHVSSRSRGKISSFVQYQKSESQKKNRGQGVFSFFVSLLGSPVTAERGSVGQRGGVEKSTSQTGKFQFVQSDSSGCGTGWGAAETIWRGVLKTSFLLRTEQPRLLCCSLRNWARRFCKKERTWHSLSLVWWTT